MAELDLTGIPTQDHCAYLRQMAFHDKYWIDSYTEVVKVDHGWIYRTWVYGLLATDATQQNLNYIVSQVFVPDK